MPRGGGGGTVALELRHIYEHGERSRPTESLTGAMFSGVLAVFFSHFMVL